jgi:hypothetical protein
MNSSLVMDLLFVYNTLPIKEVDSILNRIEE